MLPSQFSGDRAHATGAIVLIFPGALGDFLCFLESLTALRREFDGPIVVVSNPAWGELLAPDLFRSLSIDSRAVSQLFGGDSLDEASRAFAPATAIYSWTGWGVPSFATRLRQLCPNRSAVFPFRDFLPGEHAADYYARCLAISPVRPRVHVPAADQAWADSILHGLPPPILAIHAGSGSPHKNWHGFSDVARAWRATGSVVEIQGPAEETHATDADRRIREPLPRVAALLARVALYAGNDSGITHLTAALDRPGVAVFGHTDLSHWGPRSASIRVVSASTRCEICTEPGLCVHQATVRQVLQALHEAV